MHRLDLRNRRSDLCPREMTGDRQRCDHRISLLNSSLLSQFVTSFIGIILYKKCDEVSKCLCFLCEMFVILDSRTLRFLVFAPGGRVCARFEPVVSNSCSTSCQLSMRAPFFDCDCGVEKVAVVIV